MAAILVIDPSPLVRETLRIVLGPEHDVTVTSSWDDARPATPPSLIVCGGPLDVAAAAAARARIAPDAPLLLLQHGRADVDSAKLAPAGHPIAFLPKPFDGRMLRARVRTLLAARPRPTPSAAAAAWHRRVLEHPFVPRPVSALARRAALAPVPVLLVGEHGTGTTDVARAIHFFGGGGAPLAVRSARAPRLANLDSTGALVLEDVHLLTADDQARLLAVLRHRDAQGPRVFATTDADLDACVADGAFSAELAYALDIVRLTLPPLRDRLDDVPGLVAAMVPVLSEQLRLEPVHVTDAALVRLQRYLWLGNLAELESVLARTLATHRPRVVEPDMLLFTADYTAPSAMDGADASPEPAAADREADVPRPTANVAAAAVATPTTPAPTLVAGAASTSVAPPASRGRVVALERRRGDDHPADAPASRADDRGTIPADGGAGPSLEILLGELAHELRNPMVTIKTFAQHLDSLLADPDGRARFAALTGDAISRMDTLLETLLDFSRFRAPLPQPLDLGALLARALDERAEEFGRKDVRLEHAAADGTPTRVAGDEAQVLFALRSLVDGVLRDLVPHAPAHVRVREDGGVELTVRTDRAVAARLAAYVADADGRSATAVPPLPFALAAALLRRNRGRLETRGGDDGTTAITVTLPRAAEGR